MLTRDLDIIKTNLTVFFARLGDKFMWTHRYGLPKNPIGCNMFHELLLYQWVLSTWVQYEDGTIVDSMGNYITLDEFNTMINRVQFLIETS